MLKSALAYKTKQDKDFLGEYLIKFKIFLYSWGWYNTCLSTRIVRERVVQCMQFLYRYEYKFQSNL